MAGFFDKVGNFFTGGLSSGIGNFIGGIGQAFGWGRPSLSAQLDVSKQLAKYEHDLNMDAWREQNAYNDPSAQMERLKNAGINPHSIAGNASMAGNAGTAPYVSMTAPDVTKFQKGFNPMGMAMAANAFYDAKMKKEGLRKLSNEADLIATQEKKTRTEEDSINWDIKNKQLQNNILAVQSDLEQLRKDLAFDPVIGDKAMKTAQLDQIKQEFQRLVNENSLHKYRLNELIFEDNLRQIGVNPDNANPLTTFLAVLFAKTRESLGWNGIEDLVEWFKNTFNLGDDEEVSDGTVEDLIETGEFIIKHM